MTIDSLLANGADLYFHIHNVERHGADVDVGKTQVNGLVELTVEVSKVGDEPHRSYSTICQKGQSRHTPTVVSLP